MSNVWQTELTATPSNPLPAATADEVKRYARYDSTDLDAEWDLLIFKATARIEQITGKTLLQRQFVYSLWQQRSWQPDEAGCIVVPLPRGPVVRAEARLKGVTTPSILMPDGSLRVCELPGQVEAFDILEISYLAGMADQIADLPGDLRQAVASLATFFFSDEGRAEPAPQSDMPTQWSLRGDIPASIFHALSPYRESVPSALRLP